MKKLALVFALVLGISAASFAQNGGRMRRSPKDQTDTLKAHVSGVTDDQSAKILTIFTSAGKSRDSLMQASNGDRQAMMAGFMKAQSATDAQIKAILTADQAKQYQQLVDKRMAQMKARMQGGN